jgi:HAE1 family hydrophobic/amphiphilic exporter-1
VSRFFVDRPIVAIVISILTVLLGLVTLVQLPVSLYPNIAPPEIIVQSTYVGADALTLEKSVAAPIEQQMTGVARMLYMYSTSASSGGQMNLRVDFDVGTDPSTDQVLAQMRAAQATAQLPRQAQAVGVTVKKSASSPLALFTLYSPKGTYDQLFISNYAYININDPMTRVPGVGQVQIFGAGPYAMRVWVRPDALAKLGITVNEVINAVKAQSAANAAGQIGSNPVPAGQEFTYTVQAAGRLLTPAEFGDIVVRALPDGSMVRVRDVARVELGAQNYNIEGRLNGRPATIVAIYQLPGSNALATVEQAKALMAEMKARFPEDLDYVVSLDTTQAVTAGIEEIVKTLFEALGLVIVVVFVFLQGFRATLIPLLAVPVSLVGTFAVFPLLGFSINTLSLFGLVLAIGLVVDDAIVVVEAVEHHIEQGLAPREATLRAMEDVSGPVVAIALILVAVFVPTAFVPGITGRMYQQFAVTIAVSVVISAFNALTLSPALAAMLLRPRRPMRGPLGAFFRGFNRWFGRATDGYVGLSAVLVRKTTVTIVLLLVITILTGLLGRVLPKGFIPPEDLGYVYLNVQLPAGASLERTAAVCDEIDRLLATTPGVKYYTGIVGFSLLSTVFTPYNAFYFVTLDPWSERVPKGLGLRFLLPKLKQRFEGVLGADVFPFPPPTIPGVGSSGGVTFVLEDRAGKDVDFLARNTRIFMDAVSKRREFMWIMTTLLPSVPQVRADVDRDKALRETVDLSAVYQTLQAFLGGYFVNYFNRFGRVWQVYVQADAPDRARAEGIDQFYVRNAAGTPVPLASFVTMRPSNGPEFTLRYNEYRGAQINAILRPGVSSDEGMRALEETFARTMPPEMGFDYMGMSFQEQAAAQGVPATAIFGVALLVVFLIMAAQYESWSLPLAVLLSTPIAVFGALFVLLARLYELDVFSEIGLIMLIGLSAKNAILIVEYAKSEHERGRSIADAALAGARLRLRPIVMTALAFILGVLPLCMATGSGAASRRVLGTTVFGGMLAATLIAIFVVPATFCVSQRLAAARRAPAPPEPAAAPGTPGGGLSP